LLLHVTSRSIGSTKCAIEMGRDKEEKPRLASFDDTIGVGEVINASGHKQELDRQFSLLSICSIGITTGNVWAALGGSIVSCTRWSIQLVLSILQHFH
jgi:hypothetical protein